MASHTHQFDDKKANLKTLISTIGAREVDCRVRLTLHTVTNLPVLDGSFRVRWKFRDIDSKIAKQQKKEMEKKMSGDAGASYGLGAALGVAASMAGGSVASSSAQQVKKKDENLSTDERGSTPFRSLRVRDHTVTYDHTVEVIAHMRIVKGELIGEPLKLVVERAMEESETIGTNKKYEPRVGHKYIDMAEFVNEGKVRRKFLLERSKTNAMVTVSLDIVTTKTGIEFKKPALRQDHLLIGRKDLVRPLRSEKAIARINTSNASGNLKPGLTRASSTTSTASSSAASRGFSSSSRGLLPSKTETEAVIEALFNPSIFTSSPAITPAATPAVATFPPTPEDPTAKPKGSKDSKKIDNSVPGKSEHDITPDGQSPPSKQHSKKNSVASTTSESGRRPSLPTGKTILDVALELNQQMDRDKTVRPKLTPVGSDSWEFISFPDGSQGIRRKKTIDKHRAGTQDSIATDFSTTSSKSYASTSTSSSPKMLSGTNVSSPSSGMPSISIIAGTPITATPENSSRGRWFKPKRFRKNSFESSTTSRSGTLGFGGPERRATTPATPMTAEFATRNSQAGKKSEDFSEKGGILGGATVQAPAELKTGEQLTPTPTKGA